MLRRGERQAAGRVIDDLRSLRTPDGGLLYASREVPFVMTAAPSVASAAWLVLAAEALAGNPLAQEFWR